MTGGIERGHKLLVLIVKKRRGEDEREYREVTLMPLYKIYTMILRERLRGGIEEGAIKKSGGV